MTAALTPIPAGIDQPGWPGGRPDPSAIVLEPAYDALLTKFGRTTLERSYLMPGETYQSAFARVAAAGADDPAHAQRLYGYMGRHWFMPATPVLSNLGTDRGLPISCFLNEVPDSMTGIQDTLNENWWLAAKGGGIGTYWSNLRSTGERVGNNGKTSGPIPFIVVMDAQSLAVSQGSLRRGSAAIYMHVSHPDIEEFIEIRRATGGDPNRKAKNLHHGVVIPDAFMHAVEAGADWELVSPKTKQAVLDGDGRPRTVKARDLWIRLLTARMETGEPYILFEDTVARAQPLHHKLANLQVRSSNLCVEICLPTGPDHFGKTRTAVCCLSSLNLEHWDQWNQDPMFIPDVMRFLDNVLQTFIDEAPADMANAVYAASRERSVGMGVMGFHSFLQSKGVPYEGVMANVWNRRMFKHIKEQADLASQQLADERGACPDAADFGVRERFSHKIAIAPTASISIIAGTTSPGVETIAANAFLQKTLSGSFIVRNRHLEAILESVGRNTYEVWHDIVQRKGSVQHLDFLTDEQKIVFRTSFEIDHRWSVDHAAARASYVCQSQSINLFLPGDVHKVDLHEIHFAAWKKGVKSLYYCRSIAVSRAEGSAAAEDKAAASTPVLRADYEECLSCQ
jgi:ribonucleoside-diphosphate reductase alpha chain